MKTFVIDAFEYSRLNDFREGEIAVSDLPRLSEELADRSGILCWSLRGGADSAGRAQLKLVIAGSVGLVCQRCLTEFSFKVDSSSVLILADDDSMADEIDATLADENVEVIVGHKALNVVDLIEEEALLTLPLAPKHDVCPDQTALDALNLAKKASPFSLLKHLKNQ